MRFGAHISASGGVYKAFARAAEVGCETLMVYTKSNRMWRAKPLDDKAISKYHEEAEKYADSIAPMIVHAAYLINLASPKPDVMANSTRAIRDEIVRADTLGVEQLVLHPGSHLGEGEDVGLRQIANALREAFDDTAGAKVRVCLETMAGQGTNLGYKFEHLAQLIDDIGRPERTAVCLDTCHIFTAGYDFRTPEQYAATMARFDETVGLDQILCFHFNDSKHDFGSRRDRHQHIGQGFIGTDGFANFVNDPRWAVHPAILETPKSEKDDDGNETEMDTVNLATLRGLVQ